ncbi:MAG: DUF1292 domain-containing protein [Clostridia bacterium]|nr:DUF1292 domain-containing protein [Clostridia bacterium]
MSENKHECCGSGCCGDDCHGHDHEHDHEENTIHLTTDDGEEMECAVLGIFDVDGEEYIALLPENSETVFIYGYKEDGDEIELIRIEDEEEYEKIGDAFLAIWEEEAEEEE